MAQQHRMKTIMEYMVAPDAIVRSGKTLDATPPKEQLRDKLKEELDWISNRGMEITVTFRPELQDRWTPATLTAMVMDGLLKLANRHAFKILLVGEYSDAGVYHMHGSIFMMPRTLNAVRRHFKKEYGIIHIKSIAYVESYLRYVLKKDHDYIDGLKPYEEKELHYEEIIYVDSTTPEVIYW